jgi:DNA-binding LytR/AlgR family response regulator
MTEPAPPAPKTAGLKRILLVDDDTALLAGLSRALESQGYLVRTVDQSPRAMDVAETFKPDLVVLDVMMPHVDGWQVLESLRARDTTEHVPVIMLTAADSDAAKVRGFEQGADDYLTKPFSVQELRCRIAAVLRRSSPHPAEEDEQRSIPVIVGGSDLELIRCRDVYYIEGIHNYTYVHTSSARFLSRMTLGALEQSGIEGFSRVHRSFIVNMRHVKGCGWATKSSYRLRLADADETEIPVSRSLILEIQRQLGLRS